MSTLIEDIVQLLKEKQLKMATCESVTGGMIASNIVNVPGTSDVFYGGFITYTNASKTKLISVDQNTITKYGVISEQTAQAMAVNTIAKTRCDIAVAITGNAGPSVQENQPVGLAFLCICLIDKAYIYKIISHKPTRNETRIDFTFQALTQLHDLLKGVK
ncbi:competence-damage inducible protein [Bacilli bacterium]|nr:competence-damage inducible protein [Bacilli bacterium]